MTNIDPSIAEYEDDEDPSPVDPEEAPRKEAMESSAESRQVSRARLLIIALLVVAGFACAGTYFFVNQEAKNDFMISFDLFANSIEAAVEMEIENLYDGARNLGNTISDMPVGDEDFPFVSVSRFETHAEHALDRTKMEAILFAPLVRKTLKQKWETFSVANQNWIEESRAKYLSNLPEESAKPEYLQGSISPYVYRRRNNIFPENATGDEMAPIWYLSPPPFNPGIVNFDMFSQPDYSEVLDHAVKMNKAEFSRVLNVEQFSSMQVSDADHFRFHEQYTSLEPGSIGYDHPHSLYVQPVVFEKRVVGFVMGAIAWDVYFADLLPTGVFGIHAILNTRCKDKQDQHFTYELAGAKPIFLGEGDLHETAFNHLRRVIYFSSGTHADDACRYSVDLYPTKRFEALYDSNSAIVASATLGGTFLIVAIAFFVYDYIVNARNKKVLQEAAKTNAFVDTLFPETVRGRLLEDKEKENGDLKTGELPKEKVAIADFFPATTIMFADIAGFTSWSSAKEPSQVFLLLETLYSSFDKIASRRGCYKVETIGDCYVAACGVPHPNEEHAVVMARFASDCLRNFNRRVKDLEATLGPDTGDLRLRTGLHSGPVTAGVLRGDRARFQLFGDTMNTASRIETTGKPGQIQCSQETGDLLIAAGKKAWLTEREDKVVAKGKGELRTYWIQTKIKSDSSDKSSSLGTGSNHGYDSDVSIDFDGFDERMQRLIDFNSELLLTHLKRIVARRQGLSCTKETPQLSPTNMGAKPMNEVVECIEFPECNTSDSYSDDEAKDVALDDQVVDQLKGYVSGVCTMYRKNPFHGIEHASHVAMSVQKLLSQIIAPQTPSNNDIEDKSKITDKSYGIVSDPLVQFALILSALIHDADHPGVPNAQLVKEKTSLAAAYDNRCVAEQNSLSLCWNLLLDNEFSDLVKTICHTNDEMTRFRQLMINITLATDVMDADLKSVRNVRWEKAFHQEDKEENYREMTNRKATIVLEHVIQASDVAHTMQHWHIFQKWNEKLFLEMTKAYREGRLEKDPADSWYRGELGFFDFYVIPLAKKLKECGTFGVSADSYLDYATKNRREWENRGREIVEEFKKCADEKLAEFQ